jgi:cytochrome c556
MRAPLLAFALALSGASALVACGPPIKNTPIAEIPKIATLAEVMDNQATVADPQFAKRDNATFADADYAAFGEMSQRIGALSLKIKDFSKGPEFDALAAKLHDQGEALGKAAEAKDAAKAGGALKDMKATCKECHSKFR